MLSERKAFLRGAEVLALTSAAATLWVAVQAYRRPDPDFPVFLFSVASMAVLLLTFLPACMLAGEYVRTVRRPTTWRGRTAGLNSEEISAVVRWAPKLYKLAAVAGVVVALGTALRFGSITFSEGRSVSAGEVTGIALYFSVFYLLALPVLGFASRMPSAYSSRGNA
jgi:hypothetical protein